ncbi:hypothetical protein B9Z55_015908 [Caenorhabditis nigoni]|uniref:SXP/RAL-2 family protein Ani s 5-like cation-binding domain-containing protein n=1 Tax=Caenorhabditis nigoni TaxID=1611254 RepID=A0A2G5UCE9_9PELO|nr:hypothetical protein B9Z55_015908 [Caenorhabditis nigoni]
MPRVIVLAVLASLALYVSGDQIVQGALQKIFPYAAPAKVKALTTNVNKQTAKPAAKTVVTKWIPANWKAAGATVDAKNPLSKQAYAQKKALTFIDFRFSLKKYINYLFVQAVSTKYLTQAEADNMKKMYWAADTKAVNNFTMTTQIFMADASKVKDVSSLKTKVQELSGKFAAANPEDYANLNWSL